MGYSLFTFLKTTYWKPFLCALLLSGAAAAASTALVSHLPEGRGYALAAALIVGAILCSVYLLLLSLSGHLRIGRGSRAHESPGDPPNSQRSRYGQQPMTVLVTGGAGYIGSVVARQLHASGHKVVVYDSLYKGHRDTLHPDATFVQGDVLDTSKLRDTLSAHEVAVVVHMAADSLVGESMVDPAKYFRNNVVAGLSLLDAMRSAGVRNCVLVHCVGLR